MKVTFLGTGTSQGVPVIGCQCDVCTSVDFRDNRLRSSIFVEMNGVHIVVDTGPDFRQQMLRARVNRLDAVLFTHAHKDHTAGMDDIRSYNFRQKKDMPVYARTEVQDQLKREFSYIFSESKYPGIPRIALHTLDGSPFEVEGQTIVPVEVMHHKLSVYGFRFGDFTYITDANYISEEEKEKIKGSKVIVLNALQKEDHISHFTLDEAVELMQELNPEKGYLTHISHRLGLHAAVSQELPENIELAWDGLQLSIEDH
ncbi:MBL fold metallo-hydrolase [Ekhidna sp.]|uniref:MBL fold metallo-hydrolase n=1 Tax=Ekhidna sp. TaxID=2608089 RepID=UPI00329A034B